ncbi:MAG: c-type cytochrome, partial [Verrucomicrobiota bacterium]|nr:c-type cytochrome [Verrucomicrobiota bacterium]
MTWQQQAYRQIDWVGSFTAAAGAVIYDGGTWPAEYHGDYFTTEPTINILHHERLRPEGLSFAGFKVPDREETEFITAKDLWFRPIEVRVGPDGAMYVVDFYNQAVIHNDTRGPDHNNVNAAVRPDRDHYFGRIWRVDHHAAQKVAAPDLSTADPAALAAGLEHPNKAVRFNAHRLLVEKGTGADLLAKLVNDSGKLSFARIHALWILHLQGKLTPPLLTAAIGDKEPAVSRNALRIVAEGSPAPAAEAAIVAKLADAEPRTTLAAILALGAGKPTPVAVAALLGAWPALDDPWLQSAAIGVANGAPREFLVAALTVPESAALKPLMAQLADRLRETPEEAARVLTIMASRSGGETAKHTILTALAEDATARPAPEWTPALADALGKLLSSEAGSAALPLAAAWDKTGALAAQRKAVAAKLLATLKDSAQPEDQRAAAVPTLLALKSPEAKSAVTALLSSQASAGLRTRVIEALGETGDADTGPLLAKTFPQLEPALQSVALTQLLKRPEWTRALIARLRDQSIPLATLGPIGLDRLRNHPDKKVAKEALGVIEAIRGPQIAEKNKVIAQLLPQIEAGGDVIKGKALYTAACAICHKFNNEGSTLAPDLTGMGAHPRAELLTHIVDPNREVEPTFAAWMVELKDGNAYVGIITRENAQSVTVRDQAAEREVKKSDIKTQAPMNRSLMPEGLEALGPEPLRDLLAYLESAGAGRFRIIDLSKAATGDGRLGMFERREALSDAIEFARYGHVAVGEVPFQIIDPAKSATGVNLVALRGGRGEATSYPAKVEVGVPKVRATALHFLGGIAGWGYPATQQELPAAKVTVVYEGGNAEELELTNGKEFADYNRRVDVPGSLFVPKLSKRGQVRAFRKPLAVGGVIEKLVLESYKNQISPVFVAITAEAADKNAPPPSYGPVEKTVTDARPPGSTTVAPDSREKRGEPPNRPTAETAVPQPPAAASGARALLVGGGSAHDFARWFGEADK